MLNVFIIFQNIQVHFLFFIVVLLFKIYFLQLILNVKILQVSGVTLLECLEKK
jgi:hypothetical protein